MLAEFDYLLRYNMEMLLVYQTVSGIWLTFILVSQTVRPIKDEVT
jgi:hypothetical protein